MARRRGDGPSPKSGQSNCRLSDITIVVVQAPILCLVRRGPPGQRGASLTPQSGAGRRKLPLELRAARLVAVVGGVVIALSGACGPAPHAGRNLPTFPECRYPCRNLPPNRSPPGGEGAPSPAT